MATIQEAMSNSARLLEAAAKGAIDPGALKAEVVMLLAESLSARGFMAALATGALPKDSAMRQALLDGIRTGKNNAYELIVKNIIMSGCSAHEYAQKGRKEEERASRETCNCSIELALLLNDQQLRSLTGDALTAMARWPGKQATEGAVVSTGSQTNESDTFEQKWFVFFERWGYSPKALEAVKAHLNKIAEST